MIKKIVILLIFIIFGNNVLAFDYELQEIPVNSNTLDNITDTYKITVYKNKYRITNTIDEAHLKQNLFYYCNKYKPLIWMTGGLLLLLLAPELIPGLAALNEAQRYIQSQCTINKGQTIEVLTPVGEKPILTKDTSN